MDKHTSLLQNQKIMNLLSFYSTCYTTFTPIVYSHSKISLHSSCKMHRVTTAAYLAMAVIYLNKIFMTTILGACAKNHHRFYLQKNYRCCSKLVSFLLSVTLTGLDKRTSLLRNMYTRNVFVDSLGYQYKRLIITIRIINYNFFTQKSSIRPLWGVASCSVMKAVAALNRNLNKTNLSSN